MCSTEDQRTIWCGNLSEKVSEDLLYELFLQAGPLEKVRIPLDREGRQNTYAFITFKHTVSVPYAAQLMNGIALFERKINLKPRTSSSHQQHLAQQPVQSQQHGTSAVSINNVMIAAMVKTYPGESATFAHQQLNGRRDRNYGNHNDNRRNGKPYAQSYRGRNYRDHYDHSPHGNNQRNFYLNSRQRH